MYQIVYDKQAVKDIKNLKSTHLDTKAKELIEVVRKNPFANPPPYEALVGNLAGLYSRRINIKHRFVYQVFIKTIVINNIKYDGTVKIIRMWTHYDNILH
ncbi:MAG: Txe/YoeB family addiction module toxin [Treponema sp.]